MDLNVWTAMANRSSGEVDGPQLSLDDGDVGESEQFSVILFDLGRFPEL
jgi:hypothetical protein